MIIEAMSSKSPTKYRNIICTHLYNFTYIDIVGTASFFNIARLTKAVPGIVMKGLSKSSALKCCEQRRDVSVGNHFARFVRTNAIQSLRLFFSESLSSGNL